MKTDTKSDCANVMQEGDYTEAMLKAIETKAAESRASVARHLGLSRTSASTIVSRLIGLKLLVEKNLLREGRGRPGILLDMDDSSWRALGAEYHSRHWSFVETDLKGRILRSSSRKVTGSDPEAFLDGLTRGLLEFREGITGPLLPAIGVGSPGLVDCERGLIIRADDLGWKNVRVAELVEKKLHTEIFLINRNRAAGLAEARFGAGRGVHQMVYIGIGTGISAAFMLDGQLIHGTSFSAGEIGHIAMDKSGPLCACGKRGCLHVYASGGALGKAASSLVSQGRASILADKPAPGQALTGEDVCLAAAAGDALALECVGEAASWLGLAIANIITTYNPDKIILGGPIGLIDGPLLPIVRAEAELWSMPHPFHAARIERGALGESVGALGAACRVLDRKLSLAIRATAQRKS